jgi:hypothetical protein
MGLYSLFIVICSEKRMFTEGGGRSMDIYQSGFCHMDSRVSNTISVQICTTKTPYTNVPPGSCAGIYTF